MGIERSKHNIAIPPGMTIEEVLENRNMTQKEFAVRMNLSEKHVSQLINGDVALTPEVADRLARVFGVEAAFWNNLEGNYREMLIKVRRENELANEINFAIPFNYDKLAKLGLVMSADTSFQKVDNLHHFFEVTSLQSVFNPALIPVACRHLTDVEQDKASLHTIVQFARLEARNIPVHRFLMSKLKQALPKIRSMTGMKFHDFRIDLEDLLASCGIGLVMVPRLGDLAINGFAFLDGDKIVIGIIAEDIDSDVFWLSLFHELAHVLEKHLKKRTPMTMEKEQVAEQVGRELLVPQSALDIWLTAHSQTTITESDIHDFAHELGVGAGIVVGRLQQDGHIEADQFNNLKLKYHVLHN